VAVGVAVVQCECGSDSGSGWECGSGSGSGWQWCSGSVAGVRWQWGRWQCGTGGTVVQVAWWQEWQWHSGTRGIVAGVAMVQVVHVAVVRWKCHRCQWCSGTRGRGGSGAGGSACNGNGTLAGVAAAVTEWQGACSGSDIGSLACGSVTMACCQSHIVQQQQIEPLPVASWQRQKSQVWSQCTHCHFFLPTHIRDRLFPEVDPHNPIHRPATATATATSGSGSGSGTEAGLLHNIVQNGAHTDSRRNGTAVPAEFVKKNGN
jgi:hypothetical protein